MVIEGTAQDVSRHPFPLVRHPEGLQSRGSGVHRHYAYSRKLPSQAFALVAPPSRRLRRPAHRRERDTPEPAGKMPALKGTNASS